MEVTKAWRSFLAPAVGMALGLISAACDASSRDPSDVKVTANQDLSVAYVGREACVSCHEGNATNFARTGMGRSFYPLTPEVAVEDWDGNNEFVDKASGTRYRSFERDGRYFQRQYVLASDGRELVSYERELSYVVGSNNHSRGFMTVVDGKFFQAPVCWDPTNEFWMFCPGFEVKNDHFGREIGYTCVFCHNGRMELEEGTRNRYREPIAHGIGCERCHGPGSLHLERHRAPSPSTWGEPDPTIVNPARLPRLERFQVCFQCHLGDTTATVRVFRHGRSLADFRPGQRITEVLVPFRYVQQTQYDFGLVAQADRLILSRCFNESEGRLECLTCHNPHIPVYEAPAGSFRDNCGTCHDQAACAAPEHERQATVPPDDCVACHMRKGEAADRRYAQFTDHWIRRRPHVKERDRRTVFDLEPIFPEAFGSYPPGEQAYYRARASFLRASEEPPPVRELLWDRAEKAFDLAIERGFDTPESWFFLGKIHMYRADWKRALVAFQEAVSRDVSHRDATFALAQTLTALGRFDEARRLFETMLEGQPLDAMAHSELGRVHWSLGNHEAAIAGYRRAVELEPWNSPVQLNLGMTLATLGRFEEAREAGLQAARLDPDRPAVWDFLTNVYRETGDPTMEREARQRLAELAGR